MWGDGVGCCALVSLFERDVCAWQGQQQLWTCWWGRRRPKGAAAVLHVPQQVCVLISLWPGVLQPSVPHHTQQAAQLCWKHSRTSQAWVCARSTQGGHGHAYPTTTTVQPKTYHRHQVVLKTSEARSHGRYNIHRKAILTLSLQCPEIAPAPPCAGPLPSGQVLCRSGLQSPALSSGTSSLGLSDP